MQVHSAQGQTTGTGGKMDLAAAEGGTVVPLPARLYHGQGGGHKGILECGLLTAEVPQFRSSHRCCQYSEGTEGEAQKILAETPEVPPPTCTTGETGWGHAPFWEGEGGVQRERSNETAVEQLDLKRDVAANRSSSNAPPRQPPVPNGGVSTTPLNWSCSSQR